MLTSRFPMKSKVLISSGAFLVATSVAGLAGAPDAALAQIQAKAAQGDAEAEFALAKDYIRGAGVGQDDAKARELYEASAKQGNFKAMTNLASMQMQGVGGPQDKLAAVAWYRTAAEVGAALAQTGLAAALENGDGVTKDPAEAVKWYEKAAAQGEVHAQYRLGMIYLRSQDGVNSDTAKALAWFSKAAAKDDPAAENALGLMYERGTGVPKDRKEATKWYTLSANQGYANGEANCGRMCFDPAGFPVEDVVTGYMWLMLAAAQNDIVGKHYMREFEKEISDAQLVEAKKRASEWKPQKPSPASAH